MSEKKFNREWVKTVAIIFLSVLLVLTFFSNTIMNMSLPEVSTQYIQHGSIKTQVRGTGTVLAQDCYSVTIPATREISRVAVRQGDSVTKGDVLFYLASGDSEELEAAREAYDNLNYEYTKMLINSTSGDDFADKKLEIKQLEEDLAEAREKLSKAAETERAIELAKQEVRAAEKAVEKKQKEITELQKEMSAIGYTPTEDEVLTGRESNVTYEQYISVTNLINAASEKADNAEKELNSAKVKYETLKREYDEINAKIEVPLATLEKQILESDRSIEALERSLKYTKQEFYDTTSNSTLEELYLTYERRERSYRLAKSEYEALRASATATAEELDTAKAKCDKAAKAMDEAYERYDNAVTEEENESAPIERELLEKETELKYAREDNEELKSKLAETKKFDALLNSKKTELDAAEKAYNIAQTVYENAAADEKALEKDIEKTRNGYKYAKVKEYEAKISEQEDQLDSLNDKLEEAEEELSELQAQGTDSEETLKERIKTYERQLLTLTSSLESSVTESGNSDKLQSLELERKKKELEKAAEKIKELEEKYISGEVLAPVSGVIDSINVTSGEKTAPDKALAEISLAENGFRLTMTATQEQAAKLRLGSKAEITSYIPYNSNITVTLAAIKNDTANPGSRQKLLEFTVDGDVTPGQSLSIAVGDKNASYDSTVPNTAIREDSNGKYILIVESKSTPISTRYIARRVSVTVTASDDTRSAISGEFDSYAYVIATSSKPINDGEQVKLVEN